MILSGHKVLLVITAGLLISCNLNVKAEHSETLSNISENVPETLAVEVQGHENTSGRNVRQFGFPPPPPFGGGPGFGGRPGFGGGPGFGGRPGFSGGPGFGGGGFSGGGFQRTRVVTRTRTRVVDRYRGGGYQGGFYG